MNKPIWANFEPLQEDKAMSLKVKKPTKREMEMTEVIFNYRLQCRHYRMYGFRRFKKNRKLKRNK